MNTKARLQMMIAMSGLMFDPMTSRGVRVESRPEIPKKPYSDVQKKKGLKEYTIAGFTVMALNESNAHRKVSRMIDERSIEDAKEL